MMSMAKNIPCIRLFTLTSIIMILGLCVLSVSGASPSDKENPAIQIRAIDILPNETSISPGLTMHPKITVLNNGENMDTTSLQFSATLGPSYLINDNALWSAPKAGEEKECSVPFTIPFIQPGEYSLKVTVHQIGDSGAGAKQSDSMKANIPIKITHPKPPIGDCGCS